MDNYSKYLCIFGGGAIRGYAYLGVLRAFEEVGFYPKKLAGSSVGAIFAAYSALDMPLDEMDRIFMGVNFELFRDINFSLAPAFSISKGEVFLEWLRENIEKAFYKENYKKGENLPVRFKDLKRDLIILATDLRSFTTFVFSKENTPNYEIAQAIRISTAMPGLMTPVEYEGKLLADGDIQKGKPMWLLHNALYPDDLRILDLRLEGKKRDKKIKNMLDYANAVYSCMTNASTDFIIEQYSSCDKFDFIKMDTEDLILVDFNIDNSIKRDIANMGYDCTMKFFNETLPQKKETLLETYGNLREKIYRLQRSLYSSENSKILLGELFAALIESKKQLERRTYKRIKNLKRLFDENITKGFFGREKLNNKKAIKAELLHIKEFLDEKCIELSK
ncbi:MAG: patatin-like phospholipase family protein [bacterium]|nr:patatin-like phospholipase family protein [bacterium]